MEINKDLQFEIEIHEKLAEAERAEKTAKRFTSEQVLKEISDKLKSSPQKSSDVSTTTYWFFCLISTICSVDFARGGDS